MDGFTIAFAVGFGAAITLIVAWLVCLTGEVRQAPWFAQARIIRDNRRVQEKLTRDLAANVARLEARVRTMEIVRLDTYDALLAGHRVEDRAVVARPIKFEV